MSSKRAPPSSSFRSVTEGKIVASPRAETTRTWAMPSGGRRSQLGGLDLAELGIPDLRTVTERYCAQTGRSGVPALDWHFAYCLFRLAGIVQGIKKRALDGNASSADAEEQGVRVPILADQAWQFARLAGAPR